MYLIIVFNSAIVTSQILTSFPDIEIFSFYLSDISFEWTVLEYIQKKKKEKKIGTDRNFTRIKDKTKSR